jgi:hypothetical protein
MDTMTVIPTARPILALVLSVESDLGVELAVAAAWLALALEDVAAITAGAEVGETIVVKEDADDKDWVEDWTEDWVEDWTEDWVEDWIEDWVEDWIEDWVEDWVEDWIEDGDVLAVIV